MNTYNKNIKIQFFHAALQNIVVVLEYKIYNYVDGRIAKIMINFYGF